VTYDIEKLTNKESNRNKNTVEGYYSRLGQVEDRISELKDKTEIKGKTEELLVKQHNT
jgi:hypothetical protein